MQKTTGWGIYLSRLQINISSLIPQITQGQKTLSASPGYTTTLSACQHKALLQHPASLTNNHPLSPVFHIQVRTWRPQTKSMRPEPKVRVGSRRTYATASSKVYSCQQAECDWRERRRIPKHFNNSGAGKAPKDSRGSESWSPRSSSTLLKSQTLHGVTVKPWKREIRGFLAQKSSERRAYGTKSESRKARTSPWYLLKGNYKKLPISEH